VTATFKPARPPVAMVAAMSRIRRALQPHVDRELEVARAARRGGELAAAWAALERAHILSQPSAWLHTRAHAAMLACAVRAGDLREIFGQLVRLAVGGLGSALGRFPAGNTGRARIPIARPMPVPAELQAIFAEVGVSIDGVTVWRS
jgi:hypothetical protein